MMEEVWIEEQRGGHAGVPKKNPSFSLPGLGKVGPVGHDDSTEHNVILGEVAGEKVSGAYHRDTENVGYTSSP